MTKTLPISEARINLRDLVEKAQRLRSHYVITRNGKPDAVLIGHNEYESWQETLDVLTDKDEVAGIFEGLTDLKAGRSVSFKETFGEALNVRSAKGR